MVWWGDGSSGEFGSNVKIVQSGQSIQSVIDSITNASATNPYTVMIPPGVFEENIVMKEYVSFAGSGMSATRINSTSSFLLASDTELSGFTLYCSQFHTVTGVNITNIRVCDVEFLPFSFGSAFYVSSSFEGDFYNCKFGTFETLCDSAVGFANFYNCSFSEALWASGDVAGFKTTAFNCTICDVNTSPNGEVQCYACKITGVVHSRLIATVSLYGGFAVQLYQQTDGILNIYGTVYNSIVAGTILTGDSKVSGSLNVGTVAEYADNTAALVGGLVAGDFYRTGDASKVVH